MSRSTEYPTRYKVGVLNGKDVYLHPQVGLSIKRGDRLVEMTVKETAAWYRQETRSLRDHPKELIQKQEEEAALADANREMFGDDVAELMNLGILPDDIGDK